MKLALLHFLFEFSSVISSPARASCSLLMRVINKRFKDVKWQTPCRLRPVRIDVLYIEADTGAESQTHIKKEKTLSALSLPSGHFMFLPGNKLRGF